LLASMMAILRLAALVLCIPARRATSIDPMDVLHAQ
jgi:hypothetical protein